MASAGRKCVAGAEKNNTVGAHRESIAPILEFHPAISKASHGRNAHGEHGNRALFRVLRGFFPVAKKSTS